MAAMTDKVFVIGFHKTGTTSMGAALQALGYHLDQRHWKAEVAALPAPLTKPALAARALEIAATADAFEDNPWPLLFAEMDTAFPGSKFILTRRNPKAWLASITEHFGAKSSPLRQLIYGANAGAPQGNGQRYLYRYQQHIEYVLQYFAGRPDDLLIVELESANWAELCRFLHKPELQRPFPRAGTGARRARGQWFKRLIGQG